MVKSARGSLPRPGATGDGKAAAASGKPKADEGGAVAAGLQDIAQAWVDYAQQVLHRTTEATESLLKCQGFNDMLAVQAELMRGHLQAFLDQTTRLAEIANRMAAHSTDPSGIAAGKADADKSRRCT
jgi:hypothetical protein